MSKNKRIAYRGVFIALGLVLSYIETFVPITAIAPGIKIGLANIVTVFALYKMKTRDAIFISLGRIILSAVLFGSFVTAIYSLAGAFFSMTVMLILKKMPFFSVLGVSIAAGVMHNVGQIMIAAFVLKNKSIIYYLGILIISGCIAGTVVGIISARMINRIELE